MKSLLTFFTLLLTLGVNSQFEFKGQLTGSSSPTLGGFPDSATYVSVVDKKIYYQYVSSANQPAQSVVPQLSCPNNRILNLNTKSGTTVGLTVSECNPAVNAYYMYNIKDKIFNKIILPNGRNGFLHFTDSYAGVNYIIPENGEELYRWDINRGTWDSVSNNEYTFSILNMVNNKGIMYLINNKDSEVKLGSTNDGGATYNILNNIDYDKPPFAKMNYGTLYELRVITDLYWWARYSYDSAGTQVNRAYFTTNQGTTWQVAFPFDVQQIVPAGESDVYVYRSKPGIVNGELYKVSNFGAKICKTNFTGTISVMSFWDTDNGLILALDTPNRKAGIWRIRNSGGAPCMQQSNGMQDIKRNNSFSFSINPNPATNKLIIRSEQNKTYSVINLLGQIMISGILRETENTLDISMLPAGVYLMKVGDETKKWVKE